jgi:hypothetical protein
MKRPITLEVVVEADREYLRYIKGLILSALRVLHVKVTVRVVGQVAEDYFETIEKEEFYAGRLVL